MLSPTTVKKDRGHKKNVYEACGVKEYWIVDIVNKSFKVYILQNPVFDLDNIYSILPDCTISKLSDEEKASLPIEFSCSLFPELKISTQKIFSDLF